MRAPASTSDPVPGVHCGTVEVGLGFTLEVPLQAIPFIAQKKCYGSEELQQRSECVQGVANEEAMNCKKPDMRQ